MRSLVLRFPVKLNGYLRTRNEWKTVEELIKSPESIQFIDYLGNTFYQDSMIKRINGYKGTPCMNNEIKECVCSKVSPEDEKNLTLFLICMYRGENIEFVDDSGTLKITLSSKDIPCVYKYIEKYPVKSVHMLDGKLVMLVENLYLYTVFKTGVIPVNWYDYGIQDFKKLTMGMSTDFNFPKEASKDLITFTMSAIAKMSDNQFTYTSKDKNVIEYSNCGRLCPFVDKYEYFVEMPIEVDFIPPLEKCSTSILCMHRFVRDNIPKQTVYLLGCSLEV